MEPTERKGKIDVYEYKDGVKIYVDEENQHMRAEGVTLDKVKRALRSDARKRFQRRMKERAAAQSDSDE